MTWKQRKKAWRKAEKGRMMTLRQLAGLAGGLACMMLIYIWVADERKVDRFGQHDDRLFQIMENDRSEKGISTSEQTPPSLATRLAGFPEVEKSVSVLPASAPDKQSIVSLGDTEAKVNAVFAGKDFFKLFSYPLIEGNANHALSDSKNIAISKTLAFRLFHRANGLIGKSVSYHQQDTAENFIIAAVFDNTAVNSSAAFDVLLPYDFSLKGNKLQDEHNSHLQTYVLLRPGTPIKVFNAEIGHILANKKPATTATLFAQNYSDKYLHNHYKNGKPSGGRIEYVTLFTVVAFVILFIASVNFINLASAFAFEKMKAEAVQQSAASIHAGTEQTLIAINRTFAWKMLAESIGTCILALSFALLLVYFSLPAFNAFTGKQLSIEPNSGLVLIITILTALTGLAAGAYPAKSLSGSSTLTATKNDGRQANGEKMQKGPARFRQPEIVSARTTKARPYPARQVIDI